VERQVPSDRRLAASLHRDDVIGGASISVEVGELFGMQRSDMNRDDRTLGEMFAELSRETHTLIRQEVQLAKTELSENASRIGRSAGLPPWAAALLAGAVAAGAGYLVVQSGLAALRSQELLPRKTIETLKEDAQWLRTRSPGTDQPRRLPAMRFEPASSRREQS
jgi:hypothetical protein